MAPCLIRNSRHPDIDVPANARARLVIAVYDWNTARSGACFSIESQSQLMPSDFWLLTFSVS